MHIQLQTKYMKKTLTLQELHTHLGGKLWQKENIERIYLLRGYNTKKMSTKTFVYKADDGEFHVSCRIDCLSQHDNWVSKEQDAIIESVTEQINAIIDEFGVEKEEISTQSVEVIMNNALLDAQEVIGYYTEWRSVRIPINSYGKLAQRNRQFVVAFKGSKNTAPKGFVELSPAGYNILSVIRKGEDMLEPYQEIPNYDEIAVIVENRIRENEELARQSALRQQEIEDNKIQQSQQQMTDIATLMNEGKDILTAWKMAGCPHPAPAEVVEMKKASGQNWTTFSK